MGFLNDFSTIIYTVVGAVVIVALFERSFIVWRAKKKRERQDRKHREGL
jgi:hypothetical protein